jgi:hypothetical protein
MFRDQPAARVLDVERGLSRRFNQWRAPCDLPYLLFLFDIIPRSVFAAACRPLLRGSDRADLIWPRVCGSAICGLVHQLHLHHLIAMILRKEVQLLAESVSMRSSAGDYIAATDALAQVSDDTKLIETQGRQRP